MTNLQLLQAHKAAYSKTTQELRILACAQRDIRSTSLNSFSREEVLRFYTRGLAGTC